VIASARRHFGCSRLQLCTKRRHKRSFSVYSGYRDESRRRNTRYGEMAERVPQLRTRIKFVTREGRDKRCAEKDNAGAKIAEKDEATFMALFEKRKSKVDLFLCNKILT